MRHHLLPPALLLLMSMLCPATYGQSLRSSSAFTYSLKHFADTIPIEVKNGQIYFHAVCNGAVYRFCLDTGSGQGSLFSDSRLRGLRDLGNVVSHDAAGHKDTVNVVQLPQFKIGRLTVNGYVASMFKSHLRHDYDAILGFDLINKRSCCKIDVRHGFIILSDRRDIFDKEPGYTLKYKLKWWVPYVLISPFKRHVDEVLFDTGSRMLYTMNKQSFDEHAYKSKNVNSQVVDRVKGNFTIGNLGAEEADEVAFLRLDRLKWDTFSFLDVSAITTQGASRIGASILDYGSIIINGFERYIRFQPYTEGDSVTVRNKPITTAYVPSKDGMAQVGLVLPSSDDYKAGLRQGDIILAIDGEPIGSFSAFQQYHFLRGYTHKFLVRTKSGQNKEVLLRK